MRAGAYSLQHALGGEAEAVVKQAVALAKRRGHAQVTPLHVANTMLAASSGLFRAACLQSHSHPLQCKALELCFNVALNRLPASSPSPMLSHHSQQHPSISNALLAAFKRAQAHQRRGSIENQQQPLLAMKIELEQLIISILDDPSVSRVMREAGFSSTQVKSNVEKVVSLELCSRSPPPAPAPPPPRPSNNSKENLEIKIRTENIKSDDVSIIIESLMNRERKNLVIVGECISNIESRVKELMDRVDQGQVPEGLKEVKFVSIPPIYSFCNLDRDSVEQKMLELSCLVKSLVAKGVVLYLGDLSWISEYRVSLEQQRSYYCSVEHMIMELGRLVSAINEEVGRFWLVGIATFQSYMRCRRGYHSLETVWGLHPLTIPATTLGLSLISQSDKGDLPTNGEMKLTCCEDCSLKFEAEARKLETNSNEPTLSSLPPWLKDESPRLCNNDQTCDSIRELCKKWNSYCSSAHKQPGVTMERTLTFSSASPSSSTSCFSFDQQNPSPHQSHNLAFVLSNQSSTSNSPSSSDVMDMTTAYVQKFKEFNAQNLNILCDALEKQVPWQKEIIPEIGGTILQCRSGMLKRKGNCNSSNNLKEETWLFFLGADAQAKERISKELAKVVFGSYSNLASIGISCSLVEDYPDEQVSYSSYMERFAQAVSANPHRVFMVQDLEKADYCSQMGIKRAIERGSINNQNGEEVSFCDAIVVLSCERWASCSPSMEEESGTTRCSPLDLNISFEEDSVEKQCIDELGILHNVDRRVVFQVRNL
ncbi:Chaperone HSP104 [Handroanthus impetiginosus]|uniref:Chaperone HSP104 n=1 Tax=Handroanthus impetiginosus TaxID=429701 RepID=A0A2G9I806_9LAMI|nr:Chaperone HSP104 [Handroanthus impetiginosus]